MADLQSIEFTSYPVIAYWKDVRGPLFEVLATIENRIDRDLRPDLEARATGLTTWLLTHVRVARRTWELIEELASLAKQGSISLETAISIPPLARVIVESVFSTTYVLENPTERLPWFWKATWRDIVDQHQELAGDYGEDPAWADWLGAIAAQRDGWRDFLTQQGTPLTTVELADPTKVKRWPNPGRFAKLCDDAGRKATLTYFNVRFYGALSAASHLSGTGMLAQGGVLLDDDNGTNQKYFSDQVLTALTALFSLATLLTLDIERTPALARRVRSLWQTPNLWAVALETYERCFHTRLGALAAP